MFWLEENRQASLKALMKTFRNSLQEEGGKVDGQLCVQCLGTEVFLQASKHAGLPQACKHTAVELPGVHVATLVLSPELLG